MPSSATLTTAPRPSSSGSTSVSTSSRSARRPTRCRSRRSSTRWSCSARKCCRSSTRTRCTRRPSTAKRPPSRRTLLSQDFLALAAQVSNWGRWGDEDELGTLNLIDAAAVQRGAACVRTGLRYSLSLPLDENGPQIGGVPGRVNATRTMTHINAEFTGTPDGFCTSDDVVTMGLQAATHWDALAHVSYSGQLYNGFPAASVTEEGAARCGIARVESLTTRGVLLDVAHTR